MSKKTLSTRLLKLILKISFTEQLKTQHFKPKNADYYYFLKKLHALAWAQQQLLHFKPSQSMLSRLWTHGQVLMLFNFPQTLNKEKKKGSHTLEWSCESITRWLRLINKGRQGKCQLYQNSGRKVRKVSQIQPKHLELSHL